MPKTTYNRLSVDGKFFKLDGKRCFLKSVTYGPFPEPFPDVDADFEKIASAGFNAVRLYEAPSQTLLDAALKHKLLLFVGIPWQWYRVFLGDGSETFWQEARIKFLQELKQWGNHPAVSAIYIANEIPPDLARWMGHGKTREALDELISDLRLEHPHLLYAYSSYPSSEYLEPSLADFTAINVYLEDKQKLKSYLAHLHHVSGDRPVLISEFGLDSQRNGEQQQAQTIAWQLSCMREAGMAGATVFSWCDSWRNGDREVLDWSFGLTDRQGNEKPAFQTANQTYPLAPLNHYPMISVIICVHNGATRVKPCLDFIEHLNYPTYEVLIIDDGSSDGLEELVSHYPSIRYIPQTHSGLSAARNLGAANAKADIFAYTDDDCVPDVDWLYWLAKGYQELDCDLCGGPNLPPTPEEEDEAVVAAAPGAPTHVMLSDQNAEHLPGCNLSIKREAFQLIGGFNERYWVAGDDVDFCWRAEKAGLKMGFHGACFVWHRRRTSFLRYFKQQRGYGKAEALLMQDHPERFNEMGSARWKGVVYLGGAMAAQDHDTIYSGPMGAAPFQHLVSSVMPIRPLHRDFSSKTAELKLATAKKLKPLIRSLSRVYYSKMKKRWRKYLKLLISHLRNPQPEPAPFSQKQESVTDALGFQDKQHFIDQKIADSWKPLYDDPHWDLEHPDGSKMLIAMETIGGGCFKLRVRKQTSALINKSK